MQEKTNGPVFKCLPNTNLILELASTNQNLLYEVNTQRKSCCCDCFQDYRKVWKSFCSFRYTSNVPQFFTENSNNFPVSWIYN